MVANIERKTTCLHADVFKNFRWESQKFSDRFNTEYEYCDCRICKNSIYTGLCRIVDVVSEDNLNWDIPSAKEQNMSKDKLSVSRSLKSRHAKEGNGMSLKEFARRLVREDNESAKDWFANKAGLLNAERSDKNKTRVSSEKSATKLAKRSKKKGSSNVSVAAATPAITKSAKTK